MWVGLHVPKPISARPHPKNVVKVVALYIACAESTISQCIYSRWVINISSEWNISKQVVLVTGLIGVHSMHGRVHPN